MLPRKLFPVNDARNKIANNSNPIAAGTISAGFFLDKLVNYKKDDDRYTHLAKKRDELLDGQPLGKRLAIGASYHAIVAYDCTKIDMETVDDFLDEGKHAPIDTARPLTEDQKIDALQALQAEGVKAIASSLRLSAVLLSVCAGIALIFGKKDNYVGEGSLLVGLGGTFILNGAVADCAYSRMKRVAECPDAV